jgi:hypothetical protein
MMAIRYLRPFTEGAQPEAQKKHIPNIFNDYSNIFNKEKPTEIEVDRFLPWNANNESSISAP